MLIRRAPWGVRTGHLRREDKSPVTIPGHYWGARLPTAFVRTDEGPIASPDRDGTQLALGGVVRSCTGGPIWCMGELPTAATGRKSRQGPVGQSRKYALGFNGTFGKGGTR